MDRRVTPPMRVTSPTWGPPPPCKQALSLRGRRDHSRKERFEIKTAKTCGECERDTFFWRLSRVNGGFAPPKLARTQKQ